MPLLEVNRRWVQQNLVFARVTIQWDGISLKKHDAFYLRFFFLLYFHIYGHRRLSQYLQGYRRCY